MNQTGSSVRIVATRAAITRRVLEVCAMLGMGVYQPREAAPLQRQVPAAVRDIIESLAPGQHCYLSGESGSGKSTLLEAIEAHLTARGDGCTRVEVLRGWRTRMRAPIDACDGPVERALETLACAGLAQGPLLVRPIASMSEGQRWRLALALAMQRVLALQTQGRRYLLIDECASCLDAMTARCVCAAVSKWARREGVSIIAAGCWEAPAQWLEAARVVDLGKERAA
jgi:ABC-type glutathione transport system ATPase component